MKHSTILHIGKISGRHQRDKVHVWSGCPEICLGLFFRSHLRMDFKPNNALPTPSGGWIQPKSPASGSHRDLNREDWSDHSANTWNKGCFTFKLSCSSSPASASTTLVFMPLLGRGAAHVVLKSAPLVGRRSKGALDRDRAILRANWVVVSGYALQQSRAEKSKDLKGPSV